MATGTDPLQRERIQIASQDTGARYEAPATNSALMLARSLAGIQPDLENTMAAISDQHMKDTQQAAKAAALENSGAPLADAVRMGKIKATQNPWFVDAYNRESGAIRGSDALAQLQTDSASWEEKNDPAAFASKWHKAVGDLTQQFNDTPETFQGFSAAEAQTSQQVLATNQAYNSTRINTERKQNLSALAADGVQRVVQANGGHASGSQIAAALQPAKEQWIATGGSLEDWNNLAISAVTTASYSLRSPNLIDALKDPALVNGPHDGDTSQYGDGVDGETPQLPKPLQPVIAEPAKGAPQGAPVAGHTLQPPAMGAISNTFAQHTARGSAGVDIAVPQGTKLQAPVAGVAHVGQDPKSGLFVKITSPDGRLVTVLAHLSLAQVQDGQAVPAGAVVGRSGQSGDATGPHVHWQVKVDGQQVDPLHWQVPHDLATAGQQPPAVAAGAAAPELAPEPAQVASVQRANPQGPSLYDISGVADAAESDRYRISQGVKAEASDKLQALVSARRLSGLDATDRLYATFGTKILTGDVDGTTIVNTLSKAGYDPAVIAEAMNNIHSAVGDTAGLANARLSLQAADPTTAKPLFDMAVEARTKGYTPDLEARIANKVVSGDMSYSEGASLVGEAVSRTDSLKSQGRAEAAYEDAHGGTPGQTIKKAGQVNAGIDQYVSLATSRAEAMFPGQFLNKGASGVLKGQVKLAVLSYLADHPQDYAGAEQTARDFVAHFLLSLQARKGTVTTVKSTSSAPTGGNPRR